MTNMGERIMFAILCVLGIAGLAALAWAYSSEARAGEPPTWLVPTIVMPDGNQITGADGWHARRYPSRLQCEAQAKAARFMVPPLGRPRLYGSVCRMTQQRGGAHDKYINRYGVRCHISSNRLA